MREEGKKKKKMKENNNYPKVSYHFCKGNSFCQFLFHEKTVIFPSLGHDLPFASADHAKGTSLAMGVLSSTVLAGLLV